MSDPLPRPGPEISPDWLAWFEQTRDFLDQALSDHLKVLEQRFGPHSRLGPAVLYSVRAGGKRVRPILVIESARICGGRIEAAMPAAIAIELIHTFSLIHDDLPAMDNDDLRRGQPTNHRVFGEATALLAGDWLLAEALGMLSDRAIAAPQTAAEFMRTLSHATLAMIDGQAADIEGERCTADAGRVEFIHLNKTARLIEAACRLGALSAGAGIEKTESLARYGRHLGLSFQIVDDLLDRTGTTEQLGKQAGKDERVSKQTYPAVYGEAASRQRAVAERDAALAALDLFGPAADRLRDMARYVLARRS